LVKKKTVKTIKEGSGRGGTIEPRATVQICRLGHNRWSFFNGGRPTVTGNVCHIPMFQMISCVVYIWFSQWQWRRHWSPDYG